MPERCHDQRASLPSQLGRLIVSVITLCFILLPSLSLSQEQTPLNEADEERVDTGPVKPADDPTSPRQHFRAPNAAELTGADAQRIYDELKESMAKGYSMSNVPGAVDYQNWDVYNLAPYRSAAHGRRIINNYANKIAKAYGKYEKSGKMPVGSILSKDSFLVSNDGGIVAGPLFVMEKMPAGFNKVSGDWRYSMIMPDGSIFGITKGTGDGRVSFCIGCHLAVEHQDHMHFMPKRYRRKKVN